MVLLSDLPTAAKTPTSLPEQGPLVPSLCLFQVPRWLVFICRRKMVRQEHSERAARREESRVCVCVCAQRRAFRKTDVTVEKSITGS